MRTHPAAIRPPRRLAALVAAALAAAAISGCTNARIVNEWRDPNDAGGPIQSLLVVSQRADDAQRRLWEDDVVARLEEAGVHAVASYTLAPDRVPSREGLQAELRERGLDAALVIRPLGPTRETHWVPGWSSVQPVDYYDPWGRRDMIVYRRWYHRGYPVTDQIEREQVTLWRARDGARMVWAGTVEIWNPSSSDDARHDFESGVVPGLKRAGLVS